MSHSAPASRFRKIMKHRGLGQHVESVFWRRWSKVWFTLANPSCSSPLCLSLPPRFLRTTIFTAERDCWRRTRERKRERDSAPFGQRTTLRSSLSNTRCREIVAQSDVALSRRNDGITESWRISGPEVSRWHNSTPIRWWRSKSRLQRGLDRVTIGHDLGIN